MKVFLSYSSVDAKLARRLAADLSHHVDVWLDQWRLGVGDDFVQGIERGIGEADFVVLLVTRASVASEWVGREWRTKVEAESGTRRIGVIPVIAEACALPDFLAQRTHANITGGSYPLGFARLLEILGHYSGNASQAPPIVPSEDLPTGFVPVVLPIAIEVSRDLVPWVDAKGAGKSRLERVRRALWAELGIPPPLARIRVDPYKPAGHASILIEEIPECHFAVPATAEALDVTIAALVSVIRRMADTFVDIETAWIHTDMLARTEPELVERVVPRVVSWFELTDVLRRLLAERVGVGDLSSILEALAERSSDKEDSAMLAERARHGLRRQITAKLRRGDGPLCAMVLAAESESLLAKRLPRQWKSRIHVNPREIESIFEVIHAKVDALGQEAAGVVLLVSSVEIRPFLRRLVQLKYPGLDVVSRADLDPGAPLQVVAEIRFDLETTGAAS